MTRSETSSAGVLAVGLARARPDGLEQRREEVGVVVGELALDDRGDALEAHARCRRRARAAE